MTRIVCDVLDMMMANLLLPTWYLSLCNEFSIKKVCITCTSQVNHFITQVLLL